jgi:hypothetical protein
MGSETRRASSLFIVGERERECSHNVAIYDDDHDVVWLWYIGMVCMLKRVSHSASFNVCGCPLTRATAF